MPMWNEQHVKIKRTYIDGSNIPIDLPCIVTDNAEGCNLFSLVCRCNVRMCFFYISKVNLPFSFERGNFVWKNWIKCKKEELLLRAKQFNHVKIVFRPPACCAHILKKHNCVLLHLLHSLTRSHLTESLKNTRSIRTALQHIQVSEGTPVSVKSWFSLGIFAFGCHWCPGNASHLFVTVLWVWSVVCHL